VSRGAPACVSIHHVLFRVKYRCKLYKSVLCYKTYVNIALSAHCTAQLNSGSHALDVRPYCINVRRERASLPFGVRAVLSLVEFWRWFLHGVEVTIDMQQAQCLSVHQ
jgi:hypothetical protein